MPVVSIRFSGDSLHGRLRDTAQRLQVPISTLAERLIDEGLRSEAHPMVHFRSGPNGRRPVLLGGPEVVDVIGTIVGADVPGDARRARSADLLGISEWMVDAALAYYAEFTEEVDRDLAERVRLADEAEAAWRRQRELLTR
jgi:hypothetical protein